MANVIISATTRKAEDHPRCVTNGYSTQRHPRITGFISTATLSHLSWDNGLLKSCCPAFGKAFSVHSSDTFTAASAVFDKQNLVSPAGLVPVLELAEQTGLSRLIDEHVDLPSTRVKSGAVNPAGKLTSIIAGIMCGADTIDDVNMLRAGGAPREFNEVYAPSALGIFLRELPVPVCSSSVHQAASPAA